ncbi:MAG: hypothetical protein OM95_16100 [Bdellovibrio sp. ArHS]|uniref:hypothetical protein n=1 Tax=Bdellovibrio sp. ArHS TaxID=1569284 RepID=UPI00058331B7|nr:hypothetical protein [Bdellovibrio sp. ArHS]KHD87148.1 MAG: hypothetical protein OM95_16100 [Bdellovibrio sp. ArHS]
MKLGKLFQLVAVILVVIVVLIGGLAFWGLSKLPSAFEIRQGLTPPAMANRATKTSTSPTVEAEKKSQTPLPTSTPESVTEIKNEQAAIVEDTSKVLLEDFTDPRKPLIESCRHLEKAADSHLLRDHKNANAKFFFHSLAQDQKDPLVETAAPILRYIFRSPGMPALVDMVMKSEEQKDPSILKKAEFYYEIYRAGAFLKENTRAMDELLQKTYNMHYLARAVALKPELARDPATLNFCEQMEKNVNHRGPYDADEAAKEMQTFLSSVGVDAKELGYDANYRSHVKMNLTNSQVTLNDAWVLRLFAADIEKAHQAPTQN